MYQEIVSSCLDASLASFYSGQSSAGLQMFSQSVERRTQFLYSSHLVSFKTWQLRSHHRKLPGIKQFIKLLQDDEYFIFFRRLLYSSSYGQPVFMSVLVACVRLHDHGRYRHGWKNQFWKDVRNFDSVPDLWTLMKCFAFFVSRFIGRPLEARQNNRTTHEGFYERRRFSELRDATFEHVV